MSAARELVVESHGYSGPPPRKVIPPGAWCIVWENRERPRPGRASGHGKVTRRVWVVIMPADQHRFRLEQP